MPELYIITGSNGAGKSTVGASYLPSSFQGLPVFDGDKLFVTKQKELWAQGIRAHKEARNLAAKFVSETFDGLVEDALLHNETFIYEGHFTNDATWDAPKKFKAAGYRVNMIFFGLSNADLSELRVLDRVRNSGGHYVARNTIEDNFFGNLEKVNKYASLLDSLVIVDTSEANHAVLAMYNNGLVTASVKAPQLPAWFTEFLPNLAKQIL